MNANMLAGLALLILSTATFGTSGALAKGLIEAGWSPAAAVTLRAAVGAVILLGPALLRLRGRWHLLREHWPAIVLFGVTGISMCQMGYFFAVQRLSVGVALLLEYSAVILIVLWLWLRHHQRPRPLTLAGIALAVVGLVLILDVFGSFRIDSVGVLWGLLAAVGLSFYYVVSGDGDERLPPLVLAAGGLVVATVTLSLIGLSGVVPIHWNTADVLFAGIMVPWWVDVLALGLIATAVAYLAGIAGSKRLGSKLGSFIGLTEVMFAILWAWLLLSEMPMPMQLVGGVLLLGGIVAVKLDGDREPALPISAGQHSHTH